MIRRVTKWVAIGIVVLMVVIVGAVLGGLLWLRSSWGHGFVRGQIESRIEAAMIGDVRLGGVEGDVLSGVMLQDFALVDPQGVPLIAAERVIVEYALRPFFDRRIVIGRVRLIEPEINLVRGRDGRWNFQTLWKPRQPGPPSEEPGWGSHIEVGEIQIVDGSVDVRLATGRWPVLNWNENRFLDLNGTLALGLYSRERNFQRFTTQDLSFRATSPELDVRRLDGTGIVTPESLAFREIELVTAGSEIEVDGQLALAPSDSFAVEIDAPRVDLEEARRFLPAVRIGGTARYTGRLIGPSANPTLIVDDAQVETGASTVAVEGEIRTLASPRLDLATRLEPLAPADVRLFVDRYPMVQPVTGSASLEGPWSRLSIAADLRAPAGAFAVEGTIGFDGPLAYDLVLTSDRLALGNLIGEPGVDLVLTGAYRIDGRGTGPGELSADFAAELGPSRIYRYQVVALETRGRLEGRTYVADTMIARMPQTIVHGQGEFGLASNGSITADVALESENLEEVWPGLGELSGRARASARLEGTFQGFDVIGEVAAGDVSIQGVSADSFVGELALHEVGGDLHMDADGTFHQFRVAGIYADTAAVVLDYADERMGIAGTFDHAGQSETRLAAHADFTGPQTLLTLEEFVYTSPESTWRMADESRLTFAAGELRADDFRITRNGQTLRLEGTLAFDQGTSDLTFAAENIELDEIARLTGRPAEDWDGVANLQGTLRGARLDPRIELTGEITDGMIGGFHFVRLGGEIDYVDRQTAVDLTVTSPTEGHFIEIVGVIPIDLALAGGVDRLPDRPVDLTIQGSNTDLSLLGAFVPGLADIQGPVDIQVQVTGTAESPRFEGLATIRQGQFTIVSTDVTYRDIAGQVTFNNDRILIQSITGTDGGRGRFEIDGRIAMENLRIGELDLSATATDLEVVERTQEELQVNADIDLTGSTRNPVITGQVVVDEAIYRLPERTEKDVIDLDEAVLYVDIPGARREPGTSTPSLWSRTRLDLDVIVTDDAILTSSNARIEIAGDLSLVKPEGIEAPTFSGTLDVRRGFYEEFGQRFTIEEGEVFFFGTPELNPGLHVVATRTVENVETVGDVNIRIIVGGTLQKPTIDLESTPPFDKSEIISIALFGTPSASGAQQGRFNEAVRGLVTGTAAAPLQDALSEELNLDVVEFAQRADVSGDTETLFRIGKFISPDAYVTFETQTGGDDEGQAIGLRYQITEIFTLQVSAGAGDLQSGLDLFWEFTY